MFYSTKGPSINFLGSESSSFPRVLPLGIRPEKQGLFVSCDVFARYFFVAFPWLFRGPHLLGKTVFGPFSWLSVAFSWPSFWANFLRTRPGKVF